MKKESIVRIQKIFGIVLLVVGIIILCVCIYQIGNLSSIMVNSIPYEYNESGDYVSYIDQQINSGQISREMGAMQFVAISQYTYQDFHFKTSFYMQILIVSIILTVLGIMNILQAAFNNAKK